MRLPTLAQRCVIAGALALPLLALGGEPGDGWATRTVPPEAYVLFCQGVTLQFEQKYDEAVAVLKRALELDPRSPTILYEIGVTCQKQAKNKEAADYLKRSIAIYPENGPAHENLAFAYAAMGQQGEALRELETAARAPVRPRSHEGLVRRIAYLYERQGDYKKAIEWYQYLIECGYRRPDAYLSLGTLQLKEKLYAEALESFRSLVRHTAADEATVPDVARAYAQLSEAERNEAIHRQEALAKPDDPLAAEVLAMAYQAAGRRVDMLAAIARAAAASSRRAATQKLFLAEYYEQLGQFAKAIEWRRRTVDEQSPSAETLVRLAILYAKNQQMPLAAETYRKALAADRDRTDLLRNVANAYAQIYEWDKAAEALAQYLAARTLTYEDAQLVYQLGELYAKAAKPQLAAERKKQAFDLVNKAIDQDDKKLAATLYLTLAQLYYNEKDPAKALGCLNVVQRLDPDDPKKLLILAEGCKRVQDWAEAASTYEQFLKKDSTSLAAAGALVDLGNCQEAAGAAAAAAAARERARKLLLGAAEKAEKDAAKAPILAELGEMDLRRNNPKDAIEQFIEALRLDPKQDYYHLLLAQCYQLLGDWARAAGHYESYVASLGDEPDPEDARHLYRLGVAQSRSGQAKLGQQNRSRAIDLITEALGSLDKEQRGIPAYKAQLLRDLASFHDGEKLYNKAIEAQSRALQLAPDASRSEYALVLASIYDDAKRYDDSEKVLLQAYKDDPTNPAVLNHLGYFYAERGRDLDHAVELVTKALHYEPLNGAYLDSLGWAYYKQGKAKEGLDLLLRAVNYDEDAVIRDHIGDAYARLGKTAEARQAWQRALALDPDIEGVRDKLKSTEPKDQPKPEPQPKQPEPKPQQPLQDKTAPQAPK